jgi:polysaccharide biosynthesis transport protein
MRATETRKSRELRYYFALVVRWLWFLGLCTLLGGSGAYAVSKLQAPIYRATALLIVEQGSSGDPYSNLLASNQLVTTYVGLINQPKVMENAASQIGGISAVSLAGHTQATAQSGTQIIVLQVDDINPSRAALSANAVANAFINVLTQQNVTNKNTVRIFQPATPPTSSDHPRPLYNSLLGAVLGLILALCFVILHEFFDDRIRTVEQFERIPNLTILGTFPMQQKARHGNGLLLSEENNSLAVDSLRILRTNLHFVSTKPMRSIAIVSSSLCEGKTTIAINLALSLVQSGKRVLLVDADLRYPTIHTRLGLPNNAGLSLALRDHRYSDVLSVVPEVPNLYILTGGPPPPNPTELIESEQMSELLQSTLALEAQSGKVDVVVFDTPPTLNFADTSIIASIVDGVVVVTRAGVSREGTLLQTITTLKCVNACILGVVLNGVKTSRQDTRLYRYYRRLNGQHEQFIKTITATNGQSAEEQRTSAISAPPETETGLMGKESNSKQYSIAGKDDAMQHKSEGRESPDTQTVKLPKMRIPTTDKD